MNEEKSRYDFLKIRQVLPTSNGKMVSIYDKSTIATLYTATTVDAKHLVARPFTQDNRLLIPVTGVIDYLGADISWDNITKSTVIKQSDKEIRLQNGSDTAYVNGVEVEMDVAPVIKDGRTFVPLT